MEGIYLIVKYRVHEVAKDFGRPTKEIADILTKYATAPKNHMQVLEDRELSILFDYLTQHNQVQSIESIYADTYHEPKPAPQGAKPAPPPRQVPRRAEPARARRRAPALRPAGPAACPGAPFRRQQPAQQRPQGQQSAGQQNLSRPGHPGA